MGKINRVHLLLQVLGAIVFLGVVMYTVYYFTSPSEGFEDQPTNDKITPQMKRIFFKQFLEIRDILYNHFKIDHLRQPKLYTMTVGNKEINITNELPPPITDANTATDTKPQLPLNTTMKELNPEFVKVFTKEMGEELADIIGYYEMRKSFFDELEALPVNQRENYYNERKNNHDNNNQFNTHSWGYIGALVEKYLQGYPFLYFENPLEEFENESEVNKVLMPIPKSPNEQIEQRFDTLILLDLPDPKRPIKNFDPLKHREYEISLINSKQVLKLLKCYLIDKMDDPFNDEIDCDVEKQNERGISIKGYNVFSLSVNK
jgi:hypothetical protein